jgi:gliding motility-associated-like protein
VRPILLTLFTFFICQSTFSQTFWAKRQAGGNVDETLGVASDNDGNSYSTGYFSTSANINGENLNVQGLTDVFVSKVSLGGFTEWSVSFGGNQSDRGLGIAVDKLGNVLVCGFYTGSIDFGNGISLSSNGGQDAFVLKLDENGEVLWAKGGGSNQNSDRANAVAADSLGNVLITGQFSGEAIFDSFNLNTIDGSIDAFIVKYDEDGNELWAKQGTGESLDRGMGIATDSEGAVYTTGQFSGDINFDNTYDNNVLNAVFLIKHSPEGVEQWFRMAGGTEESVAYGIASDGENVFVTGDYGESISILGNGIPITIESGFSESVFIMSFSPQGDYLWSASAGSESLVSSRAISQRDGELSIAGYYRCTFESYSQEYGSGTFNSIGFEDAFTARYSSENGDFLWSRNFGSQSDEQALAVSILSDGYEVVGGVFKDALVLPSAGFMFGTNLTQIGNILTQEICGDLSYGSFYRLNGNSEQDGFLVKVLTENRSPYDFFLREPSTVCDPTVLNPCIFELASPGNDVFNCQDTITVCPENSLGFSSLTYSNEIAFDYEYNWTNPNGLSNSQVTNEGMFSLEIESEDGCYTYMDEIYVTLAPAVETGLISDDIVVNNEALNTDLIEFCEGDSVLIWATYPDTLSGTWTAWNLDNIEEEDTLTVFSDDLFNLIVTNEFGCSSLNQVEVEVIPVVEELGVDIFFPYESDTVSICDGETFGSIAVMALIEGTDDLYPNDGYIQDWTVNLDASIGSGSSNTEIGPIQDGWHIVTHSVQPILNQCNEFPFLYTDIDSIYVEVLPSPEVSISVSGPSELCPGDTIVLQLDYTGTVGITNLVAENFTDSVYIDSPGFYSFWTDSVAPNGCTGSASINQQVSFISSPQIFTDPPNAVICPGDSVQILSDNEGSFLWQGPLGSIDGENSLWAEESGLYFAEVTLYEGCVLVSNTLQLTEYATPFLYAEDETVCLGGSTDIWVFSNSLETIEWLPPLSGGDSIVTVFEPGIYSVTVTGCDITTDISIEIESLEPEVFIALADSTPVCTGDSILVAATEGFEEYEWSPAGQNQSQWFQDQGPVFVTAFTDEGCQAVSNTLELTFEPIPPDPNFQFELPCEGEPMEILVSSNLEVNVLSGLGGSVVSNDSIQEIEQLWSDTTLYVFLASPYCNGDTTALDLSPKPYPDEPIPTTDAPVCTGTDLTLEVLNAEPDVEYIWLTPNGDMLQGELVPYGIYDLTQEGEYLTYADLEGCLSDTVGFVVNLFETRQVDLPPDTALCFIEDFFIEADTIFASYLWSDNSTDSIFYPPEDNAGQIFLVATDFNGCESVDFISVNFINCLVVVPNIITPNGDGINDSWIIELDQPQFYQVIVYNRSGRKVYQGNDPAVGWDGTNSQSGEPCPEGTYFYVVQVNDFEGRLIEDQGNLTILRD